MDAETQSEMPFASKARATTGRRPPLRTPPPARPTKLLCLDIESVPDEALLPRDWDRQKFPKPAWHEIVSIAFAVARIDKDPETGLESYAIETCRSGGEPGWTERKLLEGFWRFFAAGSYRLVTWNGRSFDVPVLLTRAFIHGIPTGAYHLRGDRWSGYGKRYDQDHHADVMDLMSHHGAAPRMGLDEMALAMGLPGKGGEHGSNVEALLAQGQVGRVRAYCETDVLNTLGLYYRFCLSSGRSDERGHDASMEDLVRYLHSEGSHRPHLARFLDDWKASDRPMPICLSKSPDALLRGTS